MTREENPVTEKREKKEKIRNLQFLPIFVVFCECVEMGKSFTLQQTCEDIILIFQLTMHLVTKALLQRSHGMYQ